MSSLWAPQIRFQPRGRLTLKLPKHTTADTTIIIVKTRYPQVLLNIVKALCDKLRLKQKLYNVAYSSHRPKCIQLLSSLGAPQNRFTKLNHEDASNSNYVNKVDNRHMQIIVKNSHTCRRLARCGTAAAIKRRLIRM
jgi:hypothetical protein